MKIENSAKNLQMSQNLQTFTKFQKFQLENLVDFEKCCRTYIFLQKSEPIQPKTSNILPKFCRNFAKFGTGIRRPSAPYKRAVHDWICDGASCTCSALRSTLFNVRFSSTAKIYLYLVSSSNYFLLCTWTNFVIYVNDQKLLIAGKRRSRAPSFRPTLRKAEGVDDVRRRFSSGFCQGSLRYCFYSPAGCTRWSDALHLWLCRLPGVCEVL